LIRDLYSQGLSISEISRRTGYARETVRKYLNKKTAPEPQKHPPKPSKLDHTNLTYKKRLMKVPIPLLAYFVKSKKWVMTVR